MNKLASPITIKFRSKLLLLGLIGLLALINKTFAQQYPLEISYTFTIDDGDRNDAMITIERDGKPFKSKKGDQKKGSFELDYQHEFVITFSKKGYQTKKIAVSTKIPKEREGDEFEPILIEVVIYKQFDNVNLMVFNQPVGRYAYLDAKKDFGYDTDYTSSILSQVKDAENQLKKKRQEEKKIIESGGTPPPAMQSNTPTVKDSSSNKSLGSEQGNVSKKRPGENGDKSSSEEEMLRQKKTAAKSNTNVKSQAEIEEERRRALVKAKTEMEQRQRTAKGSLGAMDGPTPLYQPTPPDGRSEKSYVDGNKRVTEVTVVKAGKVLIYRKISYVWGVYYFRGSQSITESLYIQEAL